MPLLSFFFKKFMDTRSLREQRAFEIYMSILTVLGVESLTEEEQKKLAKFAYKSAKFFEEAIDDETIGIEDVGEKLKLLRESSGVSIRS